MPKNVFIRSVKTTNLGRGPVFRGTWNLELSRRIRPFPQNFLVFAECCGIHYWPVITGYFRQVQAAVENYFLYTDIVATQALMGAILKILNYLKKTASLFGRQTVSVSCINQQEILHIRSGSGNRRRLITTYGKFAAVSHGTWQTGPRNLEKFAAENCGP